MSKIHVFDTYAQSTSGRIMHFDVITPDKDGAKALQYARQWLTGIGEEGAVVKAENCSFCHSEDGAPAEMMKDIEKQGYAIYKLEGCPK